jgi:hypothetical protein
METTYYASCTKIEDLSEELFRYHNEYHQAMDELCHVFNKWSTEEDFPTDKLLELRKKVFASRSNGTRIADAIATIKQATTIKSECCRCHCLALPQRHEGVWYCICAACENHDADFGLPCCYLHYWSNSKPSLVKLDERFGSVSPSPSWKPPQQVC